jgi:coenzyme F420-reducing hydrogenase delta subunit
MMSMHFIPKITLFHCINALADAENLPPAAFNGYQLKTVKLPCSALVKDIFLLRAFEAGADGVLVLMCPQGTCRQIEGNVRAAKRIAWVQGILNDIGLGAGRLSLSHIRHGDTADAAQILFDTANQLKRLGPSPAV